MQQWFGYLVVCTFGLVVAVWIIGPRRVLNISHYAALFLGIMFVTYVIRPVVAYVFGQGMTFLELYLSAPSWVVVEQIVPLGLAFVGSVVSFALGYRLVRRHDLESGLSTDAVVNALAFRTSALILIFLGYASFLVARRGFLSSSDVVYNQYAGGVVYANTTGYIEYANYLVVAGALLYYASTRRLLLTLLLAGPWVINQVYDGWSRYMYLNLAIGLAAIAILGSGDSKRRSDGRQWTPILLVLGTVLLIILIRGNRNFARQGASMTEVVMSSRTLSLDQQLGDFAGFEGTWYTMSEIGNITPRYGAGIVYQFFVLPIPRLLWPSKPLKPEFSLATLYYGGNPGNSIWRGSVGGDSDFLWYNTAVKGSIGYALEEWGWPGIFINFFLTGLLFAWIERAVMRSNRSPAWLAFYGSAYALVSMQGRNDIFEFLLVYALVFFFPYWFIQRWVARGRRESHPLSAGRIRL